jgi:hypothetical protein
MYYCEWTYEGNHSLDATLVIKKKKKKGECELSCGVPFLCHLVLLSKIE